MRREQTALSPDEAKITPWLPEFAVPAGPAANSGAAQHLPLLDSSNPSLSRQYSNLESAQPMITTRYGMNITHSRIRFDFLAGRPVVLAVLPAKKTFLDAPYLELGSSGLGHIMPAATPSLLMQTLAMQFGREVGVYETHGIVSRGFPQPMMSTPAAKTQRVHVAGDKTCKFPGKHPVHPPRSSRWTGWKMTQKLVQCACRSTDSSSEPLQP